MFLIDADERMQEFFSEIADELEKLGASRSEAVARVNYAWAGVEFSPYPDIACHESPEHWAHAFYYEDRVPYWDEYADRSLWRVTPPPADPTVWTLPRTR
ncbi:hypothetical protein ACFVHB_14270 [Kitasatospora sp. NPDC127111]|uniref:hypothetical protein n=1 Tax=Kitasatospora sp. NPDC127111 TaxID=3345363 RepID=UPI003632FF7E